MRLRALLAGCLMLALAAGEVAYAQSNDNDYTPLNSRIRRERQFPTEPVATFAPRQLSEVEGRRSRDMGGQFARCLWTRSNEKALDYLARTDFGVRSFAQIGLTSSQDVLDRYPIETCLDRVASMNNSGVSLRYGADSMRRWLLVEAYLGLWPSGPTWIVPGHVVATRNYPLSAADPQVRGVMDFADCVTIGDANSSDLLVRTQPGSADEAAAIEYLMPTLSACLAQGNQIELTPSVLRLWLAEGLWHAANNSTPAPAEDSQEVQ